MQLYARNILIYLLLSSRWIYSTHLGLYDFGIEQEQKNKSFVEHNIVIIIFVTSMIVHFDFDLSMITYYVLISLPVLNKIFSYIEQVSP